MKNFLAAFFLASLVGGADSQVPAFRSQPTAKLVGQSVLIEFEVSAPTDVAVSIEQPDGKIVRHLAAGMSGTNAPPPLEKAALRQRLVWDGCDDLGRHVDSGGLRVRVSLGLEAEFEKMLGNNPADLGSVRALAVDGEGNLYVFHTHSSHHPMDGTTAVAVFDRQGRYLRTIVPFPATLPREKLEGLRYLELEDGAVVPYVYQFETRSCLPGLGDLPRQRAIVTPAGYLAFVGIQEVPRCFAQPGEARLTLIAIDGSVPPGGVLRTRIHPLTDTGASLALAPDGQTFYATGIRAGIHPCGPGHNFICDNCDHGGETWNHTQPLPIVLRFRAEDEQGTVFLGDTRKNASEPKLIEPVSVAADGNGNVYVADLGANLVRVFSATREHLGDIAVKEPCRVEVHRGTGAVYVLSGIREVELLKFDGYRNEQPRCRIFLKSYPGTWPTQRPVLVLDDLTEPPVLWCSINMSRIEDHGDQFGEPVHILARERIGPEAMASVMELSLDRLHNLLFVNNGRCYDLSTGAVRNFTLGSGRMWPTSNPGSSGGSAGRDGFYYVHEGARAAAVSRYDYQLAAVPFTVSAKADGRIWGYAKNRSQGHTADERGNVYVFWKKFGAVSRTNDFHRAAVLSKYDSTGALLNATLIDSQIPGIGSPRIDFWGNIYVAAAVRPGAALFPLELKGQVPAGAFDPDAVNGLNSYPMIYGSVVKFGPEAGEIREDAEGISCNFAYGRPIRVRGAKWIVPGLSVIPGWSTPKGHPGTTITCLCESPCLDVDGFGRVYYPDAGRARVGVLDSAGNPIVTIGRYGNPDSQGLSFWWPQAVAVDDRRLCVGDRLNRRIVVAKLLYRREAVVELDVGSQSFSGADEAGGGGTVPTRTK